MTTATYVRTDNGNEVVLRSAELANALTDVHAGTDIDIILPEPEQPDGPASRGDEEKTEPEE